MCTSATETFTSSLIPGPLTTTANQLCGSLLYERLSADSPEQVNTVTMVLAYDLPASQVLPQ